VRRRDVERQLGDEALQAGHLTFRNLHDQAGQRCGVDDRMLERALEPAADQPRVEGVVAVLHQDRGLREAQKCTARVLEDGRADEHRAVDVVALLGVGVDRRPAVDQRVEERERLLEGEALRAQLEDEERRVARGLDVQRDELRLVERRLRADLGGVDCDLLPGHGGCGAARLQEDGASAHRASESARRAQRISSLLTARSRRTATP